VSTEQEASGVGLSARQHTWLDRGTKLVGIGLIAVGLEVGGGTTAGIVLAALGVAIGLTTVFTTTA
jgi:hypothetical protein